jgi:hypothetical protein
MQEASEAVLRLDSEFTNALISNLKRHCAMRASHYGSPGDKLETVK